MMKYWKDKLCIAVIFILTLFFVLLLKEGKATQKVPSIEDLTKGKVKIGDTIDKNNVDLVKEYLSVGVHEMVKRGMVLRMGSQIPPEQFNPKFFREATERNKGKAIIDENIAVYLKDGSVWPGGVPFPEEKTVLEILANFKYGFAWDDFQAPRATMLMNKDGKHYKTVKAVTRQLRMTGRQINPPIGVIPGFENVIWRRVISTQYPRNIRGLGNFVTRYYDDAKNHDTGFLYLPAFKKVMRFTTTNYQDNIEGADLTWGDIGGLNEPFSNWKFKYIKTGYTLAVEPKSPFPLTDEDGEVSDQVKYDVGRKFPRIGWTIFPMHVVEAECKHKHIYGKKTLYFFAYPYWLCTYGIGLMEGYDNKMELWKGQYKINGPHYLVNGEPYTGNNGSITYDLQAEHMTQSWLNVHLNTPKYQAKDVTLRQLIRLGR
jgi:hypothetical protein